MKELSDVAKLLAHFSDGEAMQYREVREADQHGETHERWPLFKQVPVGFDQIMPQESNALRPTEPSGQAAGSVAFDAWAGESRRQQSATIEALPAAPALQQAGEDGGSLRSLLRRLDNLQQPASIAEPLAHDEPSRRAESIQSLFDRLRVS